MIDLSEKRELALEAKEHLESKAFAHAQAEMRERIVRTLVSNAPTTERKLELVAQLKMIDEFVGQLRILINDYNAGVRAQTKAGARG